MPSMPSKPSTSGPLPSLILSLTPVSHATRPISEFVPPSSHSTSIVSLASCACTSPPHTSRPVPPSTPSTPHLIPSLVPLAALDSAFIEDTRLLLNRWLPTSNSNTSPLQQLTLTPTTTPTSPLQPLAPAPYHDVLDDTLQSNTSALPLDNAFVATPVTPGHQLVVDWLGARGMANCPVSDELVHSLAARLRANSTL